jgi:hypothetical protein
MRPPKLLRDYTMIRYARLSPRSSTWLVNVDSISARFKVDGAKVRKLTHGLRCRFLKRRAQQGNVAAIEERIGPDVSDGATLVLRRQGKLGIHRSAAVTPRALCEPRMAG